MALASDASEDLAKYSRLRIFSAQGARAGAGWRVKLSPDPGGARVVLQASHRGNDLERSIAEMRAQFLSDSAEIIRELTLVATEMGGAPTGMRSSALAAVNHIADMQDRLRTQVDSLSGPAIHRYTIMQKVLEEQGASRRQLAILSGRHDQPAYDHRVPLDTRQASAWPIPAPAPPPLPFHSNYAPRQASSRYQTYAPKARPAALDEDDASVATSGVRRGVLAPIHRFSQAMLASNFSRTLVLLGVLVTGFVVTDIMLPNVTIRLDFAPRSPSGVRPADAYVAPPAPVAEPVRQAEQTSLPPAAQPVAPRIEDAQTSPIAAVPSQMALPAPLPLPPSPPQQALEPAYVPSTPTQVEPERRPVLLEAAPPTAHRPSGLETSPAPARSNADVPAAPSPPQRYVAVIFTHKDRAIALQAFSDLRQQHPDLLKNRKSEVQAVDLGHKGVWHRVAIAPAGSQQQATSMCERLAAVGYDRCWVKPH